MEAHLLPLWACFAACTRPMMLAGGGNMLGAEEGMWTGVQHAKRPLRDRVCIVSCRASPVRCCWCPPPPCRAAWSDLPVMCRSMSSSRGNAGHFFSTPCSAQNLIHRHPGRIQTKYLAVTREFSVTDSRSLERPGPCRVLKYAALVRLEGMKEGGC